MILEGHLDRQRPRLQQAPQVYPVAGAKALPLADRPSGNGRAARKTTMVGGEGAESRVDRQNRQRYPIGGLDPQEAAAGAEVATSAAGAARCGSDHRVGEEEGEH